MPLCVSLCRCVAVSLCSGGDGRNKPLSAWLCLHEHVCLVGGTIVWARTPHYHWWPAQRYYRSGLERFVKAHYDFEKTAAGEDDAAASPKQQQQQQLYDPFLLGLQMHGVVSSGEDSTVDSSSAAQLVYFFVDEGYAVVDSSAFVIDFYSKSREARFTQSKVRT